ARAREKLERGGRVPYVEEVARGRQRLDLEYAGQQLRTDGRGLAGQAPTEMPLLLTRAYEIEEARPAGGNVVASRKNPGGVFRRQLADPIQIDRRARCALVDRKLLV